MQDIHEKAPAEVVKINVGALKGACLKVEYEKVYYFQRFYMSCCVPIISIPVNLILRSWQQILLMAAHFRVIVLYLKEVERRHNPKGYTASAILSRH
ncbi:hypothetical protein I4B33_003932 [Enterobacter hormaechei]|nr:hypothetical protein [Enterobacter hormaechei]